MTLEGLTAPGNRIKSSILIRRESGGIGRRTGLRIRRGNLWGFKSPLSHHQHRECCSLLTEETVHEKIHRSCHNSRGGVASGF
jgi:hypothetical protein